MVCSGLPPSQWVVLLGVLGLRCGETAWELMEGNHSGAVIDWDKVLPKGFHVLPRRWVVVRTNAWITHNRRLSRDFEGTHSSSEAFVSLAMTKLMVSRIARPVA